MHDGKRVKPIVNLVALILSLTLSGLASASDDLRANPCLENIQAISETTFVPKEILFAIALTETGRSNKGSFAPWPWAINVSGKGQWHSSKESASKAARAALSHGKTSFDLGCFQLNYRWHKDRFDSLEDMLVPEKNVRAAADFLQELYYEFKNWDVVIGAYHSRTPRHAQRYRQIVSRHLGSMPQFSAPTHQAQKPDPLPKPVAVLSGEPKNQHWLAPRGAFLPATKREPLFSVPVSVR